MAKMQVRTVAALVHLTERLRAGEERI